MAAANTLKVTPLRDWVLIRMVSHSANRSPIITPEQFEKRTSAEVLAAGDGKIYDEMLRPTGVTMVKPGDLVMLVAPNLGVPADERDKDLRLVKMTDIVAILSPQLASV